MHPGAVAHRIPADTRSTKPGKCTIAYRFPVSPSATLLLRQFRAYCSPNSAKQSPRTLILQDDLHPMDDAFVLLRLCRFSLQLSLQLQSASSTEMSFLCVEGFRGSGSAHRILTVSKLWVTVTAPHAAMPPAMKALSHVGC